MLATSVWTLGTMTSLLFALTITGIEIPTVFASHACPEVVGYYLIPVHDSNGQPAGCIPAKDKQDCNQLKEFKKECNDFFKNLVGGKT